MSHRRSLLHRKSGELDFSQGFISRWNTTNTSGSVTASNQIALPLLSSATYDFYVDWGDGNIDHITAYDQPEVTHTYAVEGEYYVKIISNIGYFQMSFNYGNIKDRRKLLEISQYGYPDGSNTSRKYFNCIYLDITAEDIYENLIANYSSFSETFRNTNITAFYNVENWDVSHITDFSNMFGYVSSFNADISSWDISNATDLGFMFRNTSFNQDISDWDVSHITKMDGLFASTPFNQDISSWDVGNVTDFSNMFLQSSFNQDISSWDVSSALSFSNMFNSTPFNHDISGWNVSSVGDFYRMFISASSFSQDLSTWDISNASNMVQFGQNAAFTTTQWTNMLIAWNGLTSPPQNINIRVDSNYNSSASSARANLISTHGWTITDNGLI